MKRITSPTPSLAMSKTLTLASIMLAATLLTACQSSGTNATSPGQAVSGKAEEGITHQVVKADVDSLTETRPLVGSAAELWVNGMACPQCVSNVDLALEDLPGVASTRVDLGSGKVYVTFTGDKRPSPYQLREAVRDAGNTLVKLVVPSAK